MKAQIESINITGYMTISYNKRVIPLSNVTWLTPFEFHMTYIDIDNDKNTFSSSSATLELENQPSKKIHRI